MQYIRYKLDKINRVSSEINCIYNKSVESLKGLKIQASNYKMFLSDFFNIVGCSGLYSSLFTSNQLSENGRKLKIIISCDSSLNYSLNKKLFDNVSLTYDEATDIFCIGKKSFDYCMLKGFNVVGYINECNQSSDLEILNKYLVSSLDLEIYSKVDLYYNDGLNINKIGLYSLDQDELNSFMSSFKLNISNCQQSFSDGVGIENSDLLIKNMLIQLSQYIIYGALLRSRICGYSHCKSISKRINCDNYIKKFVLSFNEKRQALLTQKVMELMSSREYSMS